ncbi:ATP-binding cassette domain-containing protein [Sneathiella marina]|uniref:ATP-binding cassette domain-containing protein n=1 Tax=Sneathiella marina TaxID=2950108 RepID=A0ABY4W6F9_9PROT|nr:oligopeptide/dipeptide ABC transporter ATP-binding protein [Sneathiella marina]USG62514.1 ATP-binding cassette domain-containing protein [Sneathiella marina]
MINSPSLLDVEDLKVHFPTRDGATVHAVDGVSFSIDRGVAFGLVGESGSGKTTTALACVRLVDPTAGQVSLDGEDITHLGGDSLRQMRRKMQIVFQDPYASLNPRERVGSIVERPLKLMKMGTARERAARVAELFEIVGLRPEQQSLFPHQFSGGQRQRIGIARALATQPDLIVCDEPVSALDVAIQAQVLNLLARLKAEFELTYLFISHDLAVVQHICDEIAVMYLGQIVERGSKQEIFRNPLHPYTKALISAVPSADSLGKPKGERIMLEGDPPSPISLPKGCRFASRCPFVTPACEEEAPALQNISPEHSVACLRVDPVGNFN